MSGQWSVVSGQWSRTSAPLSFVICPSCSVSVSAAEGQRTKDNGQRTEALGRPGISMLEVLISIMVVAIGLVSIAALIPVGGIQVQKSNTQERTATLGLNAFREFQVRGMDNINNWVRYNSPNWVSYLPLNNLTSGTGYSDYPYLPPVAIDPLMVAVGQSQGTGPAVSTFPANYTDGPLMPRLTVASAASFNTAASTYTPVRLLADAVSTAADDVVSQLPDDASQAGYSGIIYLDPPNNTIPVKRDFNGQFTWLATMTPNFPSTILPGSPSPPAAMQAPQVTDQYTLSIVVFDRRILSTPASATEEQGQEEMVSATSATPTTVSVNGGEFTLSDASFNATAKLGMVRSDQWIMLCRYMPYPYDPSNSLTSPYFPMLEAKWYRVVTAGNITQSGSTYSRQVTLAGPDWEPASARLAQWFGRRPFQWDRKASTLTRVCSTGRWAYIRR